MIENENAINVLLIDDDEVDREAIKRYVRRKHLPYHLTLAGDETEALTELNSGGYDVILLDYDLRTTTGLELLPNVGGTPVIIITGSGTEEIAVEAIRKGASDYLIKDPERNYLTVLPLTIRNVLERKKAEKALKESEARFRALTEKVHDLAVIIDRDGRFTYLSPSSLVLGYQPEEMTGKHARDFVHAEDWDELNKSLSLAVDMPYKSIRMHEVRMRHKKGTWILFECLLTAMPDQPGVNGIVFNGRDITLRKHIEDALDESEEKLRTTLASISDLVYGLDPNGIFIDYHLPPNLTTIHEAPDSLLGKSYKKVLPELPAQLLETAIQKATDTGEVQIIVYPMNTSKGTLWFEANISTRSNAAGQFKGVTVVARDITDRKRAEEELKEARNQLELRVRLRTGELQETNQVLMSEIEQRERSEEALRKSEERLQKFMDSATESFFLMDENLNFISINKRGLEILGKKREEIIGQNLAVVLPDSVTTGRYKKHMDVMRTGVPFTMEEFTPPPEWGDFKGILKSFKVGDGLGIMLIDTTESRKLEDQLRQSQKMEAIGSLAGGIAHDFNNILGVIMGYTYLAVDDVPPESTTRRNLQHVLKAADRAKDLVSQILTFSRKEEKKRKPIYLRKIVYEVLKLLRSTLPSTIDIRSQIETSRNQVMANSTQIHQVIMNICTNAAHAMKDTGGILEINLRELELEPETINRSDLKPGLYQLLSFSDTGHGMPPERINRIFEPYFTTKKQGEGTGLGLAVVHGIVSSHGGAITVFSEPGEGTTFHIYFPVTSEIGTGSTAEEEMLKGGSERVLLVDDEQTLAEMGELMLGKLGYSVQAFTSSLEALEVFRKAPDRFDVVITDQTMPHMTGIQLTEQIHLMRPELPVILCTGFSSAVSEKNYQNYGIDAFLMKPIQKANLAKVLRLVLEGEEQTDKEPNTDILDQEDDENDQ